ncbi:MAG TPA: acyl-CoA dehydrogenase family protein, partial [Acidimicrobiales bacterium]|nr:acyl-CoA dehydrogenase family protein [Acidimicrobiales bacterium]
DTVAGLGAFDDAPLWSRLADAGVLGLGAGDGMGSLTDAAIVAMALGRALAPVPYLGCGVLAAHLLALAHADDALVDAVTSGTRRVAVGTDPRTWTVAAAGTPALAWDAAGADAAVVRAPEGQGLVAVDLAPPAPGVDLTREMRWTGAIVREGAGSLERADEQRWTCTALALVSADMVGVMEGALQLAVEHAIAREQFGVPIGSFQSIQHLLAEQQVNLEGARSVTVYAAWALGHRSLDEATLAAHTAKAYCADVGKKLCEAVVQVHGGMGLTWECRAHVFLKRMLADRAFLGDERVHFRRISELRTAEVSRGL